MLTFLLACTLPGPSLGIPAEHPRLPADRRNKLAKSWTVNCKGGADFNNLRDAIADAASGDTLTVAPAPTMAPSNMVESPFKLVSTDGAAVTTVLASPGHPVVTVKDGEAPGTLLSGFTLSGGGGPLEPAIDDEFSSLTIRDSVITGNVGLNIVYGRSPHLTLERVRIENNTPTEGIVIRSRRGAIVWKDSELFCGTATVGYTLEHGAAILDGGSFHCAGAEAIQIFHAPGRVMRLHVEGLLYVENEGAGSEGTVVEGSVLSGGASRALFGFDPEEMWYPTASILANGSNLTVEASIVTGAECGISGVGSNITTPYNDFWQNTADTCGRVNSPIGNGGFQ